MINKKTMTIFGLIAVVIAIAGTIYVLSQPPKHNSFVEIPETVINDVSAGNIGSEAVLTDQDITPDRITTTTEPEPVVNTDEIILTELGDRPEPPDNPVTAHNEELSEPPSDPALTDPTVKPNITPEPVEPIEPEDTSPTAGDKNVKGEIYIPGFGWVADEGGGSQGEQSQLDQEHSDFDKIIGY